MNNLFKFIIFLAISLSLFYFYLNFYLTANLQSRDFTVSAGEGVNQISRHLKEQGIIKSMFVFESYIWLKKLGGKMQIGEYEIASRTSISTLVRDFTVSPEQRERKITIPEGWSVRDIGFYLENLGIAQAEELQELAGFQAVDYRKIREPREPIDFNTEYNFLADKPKYLGLEGFLFPDTYRLRANTSIEDIVKKMLDNFGKKFTSELHAEVSRQKKTIFDIIRMASLVEAEVRSKADREIVADIFWRRLALGMPLQADSTINYFTFKRNARSEVGDLKKDSPWNTYKYRGLPLGPIGNPGLESILAAIYPTPNPYLYFLTDKDGNVHYAKTLEEHGRNKSNYLQ